MPTEKWEKIRNNLIGGSSENTKTQFWTALAIYLCSAERSETFFDARYSILHGLGIPEWILDTETAKENAEIDSEDNKEHPTVLEAERRRRVAEVSTNVLKSRIQELQNAAPFLQDTIDLNMEAIQDLFNLTEAETSVLEFFVRVFYEKKLDEHSIFPAFRRNLTRDSLSPLVASIIEKDTNEVKKALSPDGLLFKSRLLYQLEPGPPFALPSIYVMPSVALAILYKYDTKRSPIKDQILGGFFREASSSDLSLEDFSHLKDHLDSITKYLKQALTDGKAGVNILLYGPPGTGKSQLTRVIANDLGASLLEIPEHNGDDSGATAQKRLAKYFSVQWMSEKMRKKTLILFDEVEGVIAADILKGEEGKKLPLKGWLNRILETNKKPTFWVSNEVWKMDQATLRRFDYVLEVPIPPAKVRRRILEDAVSGLPVEEGWTTELATKNAITPADMVRGANLARTISSDNVEVVMENFFKSSLDSRSLTFTGVKTGKNSARRESKQLEYDVSYLNTDCDLEDLISSLQREDDPGARICLYGPPGTGKSAYVHYLGQEIGRRVLLKRMSDLQSMWVGQTEKNIAAAFKEAVDDSTILLIDEADSLIRDRSLAKNSWEVSQVNEFLTQMESFPGILVCSTNIFDNFDRASMRRFDLKIQFDYLTPDAAWQIFQKTAETFAGGASVGWERKVKNLQLAPGDFAVLYRQARLFKSKFLTIQSIYEVLAEEAGQRDRGAVKVAGFSRRT